MNGQHLRAFLWLRWRLQRNQLRRGGIANAIIVALLIGGAVFLGLLLFVVFFLVGLFTLPRVSPTVVLYVWDGLVAGFLFFWTIGVFTELQRSEALSLDKFLHLPVSLTGAFLINYVSSLLSLSLVLFVPAMIGLSLALILTRGPAMLLQLPLLASFLLMVTALTYQFQGWLASLMTNPRRRRNIIVLVTAAFILLSQLPNLVNILRPWKKQQWDQLQVQLSNEKTQLQRALAAKEITAAEFQRRQDELHREHEAQAKESDRQKLQQVEQTVQFFNLVLPPGWLPLGAFGAVQGEVVPALLGMLGLTLIGTASLWRAYRTTVRLYTGQLSSKRRRPAAAAAPAKVGKPSVALLEKELPWLSEHVSAIALAGFRSLLRAPEAKMMLLTPLLLVVVFGSLLLSRRVTLPEMAQPLLPYGAMAMILLSMMQLIGNQFGFDRNGFRVFVLCPAARADILLGKNLAFAPLALSLGTTVVVLLQFVSPVRMDYFLATLLQLIAMYLLFCLLANVLSILAPMPIASGSLKPTNPKGLQILIHMGFVMLFPLAVLPTLVPLGIEYLLAWLGGVRGMPICLVLSLVECVAIVYGYRQILRWQGSWLHAREQKILEIVTRKVE